LGYYSLEADYLGFGESTILHPYIYEKSSADAVVDFIFAGRNVASTKNITLNGQVFLAGYSEGGYVTLAAQKEIEKNYKGQIDVAASAPMAGPYDLNLTARTILQNATYPQPGYLAFIFLAYNNLYGWNKVSEMFNEPYANLIPSLFDGSKNLNQINAALTTDMTKLLKKDFVDSFLAGSQTEVISALTANSLIDGWTPVTPIKFFHGNADDYVPYQNSVEALNAFKSRGANVDLVTINGGTHITSAVPSIIGAVTWFESLRLNKYLAVK
jgi:predicted esterase